MSDQKAITLRTTPPRGGRGRAAISTKTREEIANEVFELMKQGMSLEKSCAMVKCPVLPGSISDWVLKDPEGIGKAYAHAREVGYRLLGDRLLDLSNQTTAVTKMHELDKLGNPMYHPDGSPVLKEVTVGLNADVIAHRRLQVDTLKWQLSKVLPKIYGDKVTQEITGANGGPVQLAAVNLRNLSDDELDQMEKLMSKAAGAKG
jgi:hypothetical protein